MVRGLADRLVVYVVMVCPMGLAMASAPAVRGMDWEPAACPMDSAAVAGPTGSETVFAPAVAGPTVVERVFAAAVACPMGLAMASAPATRGMAWEPAACPMGLGRASDGMACGMAWPVTSGPTLCVVREHPTA